MQRLNTIDRALQAQWLEREYVWGPGDNGIDELLAQYQGAPPGTSVEEEATILAWQGKPWWALQDASGDVVAVCETPAPVSGNPVPTRVVQQYTYEPYGAVIVAETDGFFTNGVSAPFAEPPVLHVGHKGLFADRLDGLITGTGTGSGAAGAAEMPRLERATATNPARLVYHTRNRVLSPDLGRWVQRDPLHSGQPNLYADAYHAAKGLHGEQLFVNALGLFRDGLNPHAYVDTSPIDRADPSGLFFSLVPMTIAMYNDAAGSINTAHEGNMVSFGLGGLFRAYAVNQMLDFEAIEDWDLPDEALSFHASNTASTREQLFGTFENAMDRSSDSMMWQVPAWHEVVASAGGGGSVDFGAIPGGTTPHGEADHWKQLRTEVLRLATSGDVDIASIKINRALRDANGNIIDRRRPDIQYRTKGGQVRVLEIFYSETKTHAKNKWDGKKSVPGVSPDDPVDARPRKRKTR